MEKDKCFQVNYMSNKIHEFDLVEFNSDYVIFSWADGNKIRRGKVYHSGKNEVWFTNRADAETLCIEDNYKSFFRE